MYLAYKLIISINLIQFIYPLPGLIAIKHEVISEFGKTFSAKK